MSDEFGLIWAHTVCSGMLVRLFTVVSAFDQCQCYHSLNRKHSDLEQGLTCLFRPFCSIIYGNFGKTRFMITVNRKIPHQAGT